MTTVAHLTTVDLSLRSLLMAQLLGARDAGYDVVGISAPGPWVPELEAEGIRHVALHDSARTSAARVENAPPCSIRTTRNPGCTAGCSAESRACRSS